MRILTYAAKTDIGRVREENQDALGKFPADSLDPTNPKGQLFLVADGMGGHAGGQEASRLAVETIGRVYFASSSSIVGSLTEAFNEANRVIYEYSLHNPRYYGMGTTCTALVIHHGSAFTAHIGDSRLYRITRNGIEQMTHDHSKVAEMVRRGIISADEARWHPERSMLYRAMGVRVEVEFDLQNGIGLGSDERFLICTDGLTGYVEPEELREIVMSNSPQSACDRLVDLANHRGGHDNITLQIIHVKGEDSFLKTLFRTR